MSGLAWKDVATRTAVVGAISAFETTAGRTYTDPSDAAASAQQAAEFISSNIRVGSETTPSADSTRWRTWRLQVA